MGDPEVNAVSANPVHEVLQVRFRRFGHVAGEGPVQVPVEGGVASPELAQELRTGHGGCSVAAIEKDSEPALADGLDIDTGLDPIEVPAGAEGIGLNASHPVEGDLGELLRRVGRLNVE